MGYWNALRRMNDHYSAVMDNADVTRGKSYTSTGGLEITSEDSIAPWPQRRLPGPSLGWQRGALGAAAVLGLLVAIAGIDS